VIAVAPAAITRAGGSCAAAAADTSRTVARIASAMFSPRKTRRPMPRPIRTVTPGARNFSGASRNEMATTMPSHVKTAAVAVAPAAVMRMPCPRGTVYTVFNCINHRALEEGSDD
jgi:hypothetical protein